MDFQERISMYRALVDEYLKNFIIESKPRSLYQPSKYILAAGGKRVRPMLVLLAAEVAGGRREEAIHAAAAMEILHNFTLVHDDIMDHADSRRGRATVHTKWDANVAILTGDVLIALAYRALLKTESKRINEIAGVFTEGVVEVCEGQSFDKEFETNRRVGIDDYLMMISKKTGTLVAVSTEIGAVVGNANEEQRDALRRYGQLVGRAFQIQDDLLDIVADEKEFGKPIGGDILEGKKTFLLLHAMSTAKGRDKRSLMRVFNHERIDKRSIREYRRIYHETGALEAARTQIGQDITDAHKALEPLSSNDAGAMLSWYTDMLLNRTY